MTGVAGGSTRKVYISQGEFAVSSDPDDMISAILGSCVAVCIWDPKNHVGGMNHILLPDEQDGGSFGGEFRFGAFEMERLINEVVKSGADRRSIRARVFGGANMLNGLSSIGQRNIEFVNEFLRREDIPTEPGSVGGNQARHVRFWPHAGKAQQRLAANERPVERVQKSTANDVELF